MHFCKKNLWRGLYSASVIELRTSQSITRHRPPGNQQQPQNTSCSAVITALLLLMLLERFMYIYRFFQSQRQHKASAAAMFCTGFKSTRQRIAPLFLVYYAINYAINVVTCTQKDIIHRRWNNGRRSSRYTAAAVELPLSVHNVVLYAPWSDTVS